MDDTREPKPCPEWPYCDDDEGPCYACTVYEQWRRAQHTEDED